MFGNFCFECMYEKYLMKKNNYYILSTLSGKTVTTAPKARIGTSTTVSPEETVTQTLELIFDLDPSRWENDPDGLEAFKKRIAAAVGGAYDCQVLSFIF